LDLWRALFQVLRAWYDAQPTPPAVKATAKSAPRKKAAANNNLPGTELRTTVYIEARPKGRREGSAIGLCRRGARDRVLKTFKTPAEAIPWAKSEGTSPHVARVRHLNDKKIRDHWRLV
jgi:hypothetical protein